MINQMAYTMHESPTGNRMPDSWYQTIHDAGLRFSCKITDAAPSLKAMELASLNSQHTVIYRRSVRANSSPDKPPSGNPDIPRYDAPPDIAAREHWEWHKANLPPEVSANKAHVWIETINEVDKNRSEWLAEFALHTAKFMWSDGYKWLAFGWAGGEPEPEHWRGKKMLEFLRLCADNTHRLGIAVHEYSLSSDIWRWKGWLIGRYEFILKTCDDNGISYPRIDITEWGWGKDNGTLPSREQRLADYQSVWDVYYSNSLNVKSVAIWCLNGGAHWGGIGNELIKDVPDLLDMTLNYLPSDPPVDPPVDPPPTPSPTTETLAINFTGFGEKDNESPVGWYDSVACPNVQVPYAIDENSDREPMAYEAFSGDNPFGDGKSWNDFACPEGVVLWDDLLPPNEHYFLNEEGRCYHWFAPQKAGRSRFAKHVSLASGTYRLSLDFYGDFAKIENGQKVPQDDPNHGQVELFIGDDGLEDMININLLGENHIIKEFTVNVDGMYDVGYGVLSRYAAGDSGVAGLFLQGFKMEKLNEPVEKPKIVIVKKPQIANMTLAENRLVAEWAWSNYGRTATHSTDDMLQMLRGGNADSYAVVWYPERQPEVISILEENGFSYITMPENEDVVLSVPHISQNGLGADLRGNDCGAACAAMVVNGMTVNKPTVDTIAVEFQNPANSYMNFNQIYMALNHYSVDGVYERPFMAGDTEATIRSGEPVIALVWYQSLPVQYSTFNGSHFIVIYGTSGNKFLYRDPLMPNDRDDVLEISHNALENAMADVTLGENMAYQGMACFAKDEPPIPPPAETYTTQSFMSPDPRAFVVVDRGSAGGENVSTKWIGDREHRVKNASQKEVYEWRDGTCWRILDTSPADDPQYGACLYLQYTDGISGGQIAPKEAAIGVTYEYWSDVQFKRKSDCLPLDYRSGRARSTFTLESVKDNFTFSNGVTVDRLYTTVQTGEYQLYAVKDGVTYGWCGGGATQSGNTWSAMPIEFYTNRRLQDVPPDYCS